MWRSHLSHASLTRRAHKNTIDVANSANALLLLLKQSNYLKTTMSIDWDTFRQSLLLSLFVMLACNSINGLAFLFWQVMKSCCCSSCFEQIGTMMSTFEKMASMSDVAKHMFSACVEPFDISRSDLSVNPHKFHKEDNREDKCLRKSVVLVLGILSIAVMAGELFALATATSLLTHHAVDTVTPLAEMDLIKMGNGGRQLTDECTFNGALIDEGAHISFSTVSRQDVRLDAFGVALRKSEHHQLHSPHPNLC